MEEIAPTDDYGVASVHQDDFGVEQGDEPPPIIVFR
jgi:hypothetical protein